jgi:hypothetical protein
MAADLITFSGSRKTNERNAITITARFRNVASQADVAPTNVYYRLDAEDGCQIADWTSATPGTTVDIMITAEQNKILNCLYPIEAKILTVMADKGLSTQFANSWRYEVKNLPWSTA